MAGTRTLTTISEFSSTSLDSHANLGYGVKQTIHPTGIARSANLMKHRLYKDDDGHWYLYPADKRDAVDQYFLDVYNFWYGEDSKPSTEPEYPAWLIEINSPYELDIIHPIRNRLDA